MSSFKVIKVGLALTLLLTACSTNNLRDELESHREQQGEEDQEPLIIKPSIQQDEPTKDKYKILDNQYEKKEGYSDPNEFAKFAGHVLFEFYNLDLSANKYMFFIQKYGSSTLQNMILDIDGDPKEYLVNNILSLIEERGTVGIDYAISEVQLNGDEGYFYRKVINESGLEEYYITTIVKEEGVWKFEQDRPTSPFEVIDEFEAHAADDYLTENNEDEDLNELEE